MKFRFKYCFFSVALLLFSAPAFSFELNEQVVSIIVTTDSSPKLFYELIPYVGDDNERFVSKEKTEYRLVQRSKKGLVLFSGNLVFHDLRGMGGGGYAPSGGLPKKDKPEFASVVIVKFVKGSKLELYRDKVLIESAIVK